MDVFAVILVVAAIVAAYAFTIVPLLPGTLFVPVGALGWGALRGWEPFPWWFWVGQALLVVAYIAVDNVAQVLGVGRLGGSRASMVGGSIGVVAGTFVTAPFLGPFALLLGPPLGAVAGTLVGELVARRRAHSAADATTPLEATPTSTARQASARLTHLGAGSLVAFVAGTAAKVVLVSVQCVWLVIAVW